MRDTLLTQAEDNHGRESGGVGLCIRENPLTENIMVWEQLWFGLTIQVDTFLTADVAKTCIFIYKSVATWQLISGNTENLISVLFKNVFLNAAVISVQMFHSIVKNIQQTQQITFKSNFVLFCHFQIITKTPQYIIQNQVSIMFGAIVPKDQFR